MDNGNIEKKADLRAEVGGLNKTVGGTPITERTKVPFESQLLKRLKPDGFEKKAEVLGGTPITEKTVKKIETPTMSDAQKRVEIARIVKRLNKELAPSNEDEELIKGIKKKEEEEETLRWAVTPADGEKVDKHEGLDEFLESKKLPIEESSENVIEKQAEEAVPVTPPPPIDRPGKPLENIVNPEKNINNSEKSMTERNQETEERIRKLQQESPSVTETPASKSTPVSPPTESGDWREERKKEGEVGAAQTAIEQIKMDQARRPKTNKPEPVKPEPIESKPVEPKRRLNSFRKAIKESERMSNFRKEIKEAKEKGNL